jgi:predicted  nucleic acid-binding Zn-ribbon protein
MGPNNIALVKLYQADQALRAAQQRLDAATRDVRIQERRTNDVKSRLDEAGRKLKEAQARAGTAELDLKTRDAHIEKLRNQQQNARNNKEYQALLVEINTQKIDRNKAEDATMKALEEVERTQAQIRELSTQLEGETTRLAQMKSQIGERVASLQAEIDALVPAREQAAAACSPKAIQVFERLADRLDGEAMAALTRPHPKREEYACTACNMDVVTDVYNRLHSRDDLVFCPSCGRILYIPEDLTPEMAVNRKKEVKERRPRASKAAAAIGRQTSAVDVLNSMRPDEDETESADAPPEPAAGDAPGASAGEPSGAEASGGTAGASAPEAPGAEGGEPQPAASQTGDQS